MEGNPNAQDAGQDAQGDANGAEDQGLKAHHVPHLFFGGAQRGEQPKLPGALGHRDGKGVVDENHRGGDDDDHDNGGQAVEDGVKRIISGYAGVHQHVAIVLL